MKCIHVVRLFSGMVALVAATISHVSGAEPLLPPRPPRLAPVHDIDPRLRESVKQGLRSFPDVDPVIIGRNGTPFVLSGKFERVAVSGARSTEGDIRRILGRVAPLFSLAPNQLELISDQLDEYGIRHFAFGVKVNELPVVGASLLLHVNVKGELILAGGTLPDEPEPPSTQSRLLLERAKAEVVRKFEGRELATEGERLVYVLPGVDEPLRLVWEMPFTFADENADLGRKCYVDASTGEIIGETARIRHALGDDIIWDAEGIDWILNTTTGAMRLPVAPPFSLPQPRFWVLNGVPGSQGSVGTATVIADSHFWITSNYFWSSYALSGPDGFGNWVGMITNARFTPGFGSTGNNAAWAFGDFGSGPRHYLIFGMGPSIFPDDAGNYAFALDIVGHEFTHGISYSRPWGPVGNTSIFWGNEESEALEESLCDIFGNMTEAYWYGQSNNTWLLGEDLVAPLRSLANPAAFGGIDYYTDISSDEYRDSGISSLAFKLLVTGGTHPNPNRPQIFVPPVGRFAAEQIFFYTLRYVLPSGSNFLMARALTELTASTIFSGQGQEWIRQSVGLAWEAVGVPGGFGQGGGGNFRAINISTRAYVGTGDDVMIGGFCLGGGSTPKDMLIRGVGPQLGLAPFNLSGVLSDPFLNLNGITTNDDWEQAPNAAQIASVTQTLGAFALNSGSKDSAILTSLGPGCFTAITSGQGGGTGVALFESYDANTSNPLRLVNLSTRARIRATDPAIAGFIIQGNTAKLLLIRAVGPTLGSFGLPGTLANPRIALYAGAPGTLIFANDDWGDAWNASAIAATAAQIGAFALNSGSTDAAILIALPPGSYTAIVEGGEGIALVEVYEAN